MNRNVPLTAAVLTASLMLGGASAANAATYTFSQLHSGDKSEVSNQLSVNVTEYGSNAVSFTFYNNTGAKAPTSTSSLKSSEAEAYAAAAVAAKSEAEAEDSSYAKFEDSSSKSEDSYAKSEDSSSKSEDSYAKSEDSNSKSEDSNPKSEDSNSKSEESSKQDSSGNSKEGQNSSITDVYLAGTEGMLVLPGKITAQSAGVSFSTGATPKNLPGGKPYGFVATAGAGSNAPVNPNGVNSAKEYVTWTFALASGTTYKDVVSALDSGKMRIGLLVPGSTGGSASFLNNFSGSAAVPLPASIWLMFGALGGLGLISRRRRGGGNSAVSAISCAA